MIINKEKSSGILPVFICSLILSWQRRPLLLFLWNQRCPQYLLHEAQLSSVPKACYNGRLNSSKTSNSIPCQHTGLVTATEHLKGVFRCVHPWFAFMNLLLLTLQLTSIYGNIYTLWMGQTPLVVLSGYKAVKEGIVTHSEEISGRPLTPFYRDMMGNKGTRCDNTEISTRQRKMLSYRYTRTRYVRT